MAQYSILNREKVLEILKPYGITDVKSFGILSGGSENSNYKIDCEIGRIVLTICEQKSFEEALSLTKLLIYLEEKNFPTSKLIRTTDNESLSIYNGKPVMIKQYLEGKIITDFPEHLLERIGTDVAKLHTIESPDYMSQVMWCGKERFYEVETYALNSSFDKWIKEVEEYIDEYLTVDLPKALIHTDIFDNNIIVNDDETTATIMDFEEGTYYYRIFDIAMLIIGLCIENGTINFAKVSSILKGYTTNLQLTANELRALQPFTVYAAAGVAFWRHKNFNYTVPDDQLKDSYVKMKILADAIKELPNKLFDELSEID